MSFTRLLLDEAGATAIEYCLLASAIAMAIILTVAQIGQQVDGMYIAAIGAFG